MTEAEMLSRMSSRELTRWYLLYQVEAEERQRARDLAEHGEVNDPKWDADHGDDDGDEWETE